MVRSGSPCDHPAAADQSLRRRFGCASCRWTPTRRCPCIRPAPSLSRRIAARNLRAGGSRLVWVQPVMMALTVWRAIRFVLTDFVAESVFPRGQSLLGALAMLAALARFHLVDLMPCHRALHPSHQTALRHRRPIELERFMELADEHRLALATVSGDVDLSTVAGSALGIRDRTIHVAVDGRGGTGRRLG